MTAPEGMFYPSGRLRRQRRVVQTPRGPRIEFRMKCPQMCHGFGRCSQCGDTGYVGWRRPRPYGRGVPSW